MITKDSFITLILQYKTLKLAKWCMMIGTLCLAGKQRTSLSCNLGYFSNVSRFALLIQNLKEFEASTRFTPFKTSLILAFSSKIVLLVFFLLGSRYLEQNFSNTSL